MSALTTLATMGGDSLSAISDFLDFRHICKLWMTGNIILLRKLERHCRTVVYENKELTGYFKTPAPRIISEFSNLKRLVLLAYSDKDETSRSLEGFLPTQIPTSVTSLKLRASSAMKLIFGPATPTFAFGSKPSTAPKPVDGPVFKLQEHLPLLEELILEDVAPSFSSAPLLVPSTLRLLHLPDRVSIRLEALKALPSTLMDLKFSVSVLDGPKPDNIAAYGYPFPSSLTALTLLGKSKNFIYELLPPNLSFLKTETPLGASQARMLPAQLEALTVPFDLINADAVSSLPRKLLSITFLSSPSTQNNISCDYFLDLPPNLTALSHKSIGHFGPPFRTIATMEYANKLPRFLEVHDIEILFNDLTYPLVPRRLNKLVIPDIIDHHTLSRLPYECVTQIKMTLRLKEGSSKLQKLPHFPKLRQLEYIYPSRDSLVNLLPFISAHPKLTSLVLIGTNREKHGVTCDALSLDNPGNLTSLTLRDTDYPIPDLDFTQKWAANLKTLEIQGNFTTPPRLRQLPTTLTCLSLNTNALQVPDLLALPPKLETLELAQVHVVTDELLSSLPRSLTRLHIHNWGVLMVSRMPRELLPRHCTDIGQLARIPEADIAFKCF